MNKQGRNPIITYRYNTEADFCNRGFGFGAAITDAYRRKLEVVCRGFSGYNTQHALHILPRIIPAPCKESCIKLVTVFFGANDAVLEGQYQHVPLEEYRENLKKIFTHPTLTAHETKFVCIIPAPICEYKTQEHDKSNGKDIVQRLAPNTKKYAHAALEVAKELGIPTANLWKRFISHAGGYQEGKSLPGSKDLPRNDKLGELLRDGLHFSPAGYKLMYEEVMKTILENYPEYDPTQEKMEFVFDHWEKAPKA
ncbi:GDSL Lipase/Acylhydrolase family protein [Geopyxis carbonaria]|nr:GDSL Lipase/Acylhydrolase family protein [Geopyxis carbonaria]